MLLDSSVLKKGKFFKEIFTCYWPKVAKRFVNGLPHSIGPKVEVRNAALDSQKTEVDEPLCRGSTTLRPTI